MSGHRFNTEVFIKNLFDEARSSSGTWKSVTIQGLIQNQEFFTEKDLIKIIDTGCNIINDDKEDASTKFKLAQLFSQLYSMKFHCFEKIFIMYSDSLGSFIETPQQSYLWKPTAKLLSNIIFHLKPINNFNLHVAEF